MELGRTSNFLVFACVVVGVLSSGTTAEARGGHRVSLAMRFDTASTDYESATVPAAPTALLATYDFTGASRTPTTDSHVVGSAFDGGPGFQTVGVDNSTIDALHGNAAPSVAIDATFTDGTTQGQALTANDFYTFSISPVAGYSFSLSSLSFDYANYGPGIGSFPAENFFVRTSADGFNANLAGAVTAGATTNGTFANASISLSAKPELQNVSGPLEIRIYIYDNTTTAGRGALLDNITLNGTFALVPEPSTYALTALGALMLCGVRRVRKAS